LRVGCLSNLSASANRRVRGDDLVSRIDALNLESAASDDQPSVDSGFPWWLQLQHFLNVLFMMFIIRAGIQILADHPQLYWTRALSQPAPC